MQQKIVQLFTKRSQVRIPELCGWEGDGLCLASDNYNDTREMLVDTALVCVCVTVQLEFEKLVEECKLTKTKVERN